MDEKAKQSRKLVEKAWDISFPLNQNPENIPKAIELYEQAIKIDDRNVLAYHGLANIFLDQLNNLEKAESYCMKALDVKDIPTEISAPSFGVNDILEENADEFYNILMRIELKKNDVQNARIYLEKNRLFFEKYGKGKYHVAQMNLNEHLQKNNTQQKSSSKIWAIILIIILLLINFLS